MSDQRNTFPHTWQAERLLARPLIAPARHFTLPRPVPGEEETLARGALELLVRPAAAEPFLATCALGFADPSLPSGLWSCPNPDHLCAVAGGYAYLIPAAVPERTTHLPLRPVAAVLPAPEANLLLFAGFHHLLAWGVDGLAWQTARLSWEGLTDLRLDPNDGLTLHGLGWDMPSNRELPFSVDLRSGTHTGSPFPPRT